MTKQVECYYLLDAETRTVFWTDDEDKMENYPSLDFIGSSLNPNKRMAVASLLQHKPTERGWKIRELT